MNASNHGEDDRRSVGRLPDPTEPTEDDDDVVVYLANALNDIRNQLDRAQATIVTALVIARLAIQRRLDGGESWPGSPT